MRKKTKLLRHLKDIGRSFGMRYLETSLLDHNGEEIPLTTTLGADEAFLFPRDPSLREQLAQWVMAEKKVGNIVDLSQRQERYLNAQKNARYASSGTKRKWRRVLGL